MTTGLRKLYISRAIGSPFRFCLLFAIGSIVFGLRFSVASEPLMPAVVMEQAQSNYFAEDSASLVALAAQLEPWRSSSRAIEVYAYAYSQFRLLQLAVLAGNTNQAKQVGSRCTETLERLLKSAKNFAEGYALQSACYGYLANLGGLAAIRNGSRSGKAIEAALALAPTNPRVMLVDGFGVYYRPAFVGGDKAEGCKRFVAAAASFANSPDERVAALEGHDWGQAEAYFFMGRCARDAGDEKAAAAAFAKAVQLAPQFKRAIRASAR